MIDREDRLKQREDNVIRREENCVEYERSHARIEANLALPGDHLPFSVPSILVSGNTTTALYLSRAQGSSERTSLNTGVGAAVRWADLGQGSDHSQSDYEHGGHSRASRSPRPYAHSRLAVPHVVASSSSSESTDHVPSSRFPVTPGRNGSIYRTREIERGTDSSTQDPDPSNTD
jgi:hypothetical protein